MSETLTQMSLSETVVHQDHIRAHESGPTYHSSLHALIPPGLCFLSVSLSHLELHSLDRGSGTSGSNKHTPACQVGGCGLTGAAHPEPGKKQRALVGRWPTMLLARHRKHC